MSLSNVQGDARSSAQALDGQTARLDTANGRTADVIALTDKCDERNAELYKALQPAKKWWRP